MSSIVSGVETLDTFSNSDVVNVCTRLLNEATTTRMNLTEAVKCFLWNVHMLNGQVARYMEDPDLDIEDRKDCIEQATEYFNEMRDGLIQYSQESYSDEPPDIVGGDE
jgi:hypothetical protein